MSERERQDGPQPERRKEEERSDEESGWIKGVMESRKDKVVEW